MDINDLAPGRELQLIVKVNRYNGTFDTRVTIIHNNICVLEPIYVNDKIIGFPSNCEVSLSCTMEGILYLWKNIKIQTILFKGVPCHAAELIGDAEPVNRRNNYRVNIGEEMELNYYTDKGPRSTWAYIKDVSETGFAFITKEIFQLQHMVRLTITIEGRSNLRISAKIVRFVELEDDQILYGCKFVEQSQKLNNWLMSIQRDKSKLRLRRPAPVPQMPQDS